MAYVISEQLLSYNRSHQSLSPEGFVIHSTATPNATAQNEYKYFNSGDRQASVHYFVDWTQIIRTVPENEVAWGCGKTGNHKYIQLEMCEPMNNSSKFQEVWNRTVWLVADSCVRYGWNTEDNVWSHRGISNLYHETDHTDPIQFLASNGKTWDQLLQAIDAKIIELKNQTSPPSSPIISQPIKGGTNSMKNLVIYKGQPDLYPASVLANYLHCPIAQLDDQFSSDMFNQVENVYQVGGTAIDSRVKLISGADRYLTIIEVMKHIKKI